MSPLYLYNNRLLVRSGGLAVDSRCCCQPCTYCDGNNMANYYGIYNNGIDPNLAPHGATGVKKPYLSCAGIIRIEIFTGSLPDRVIARNSSNGVVLFDTGCVQHGTSTAIPYTVVFGRYDFCKPAGVTNVDVTITTCNNNGGATVRVSNCLIGPCP